jgi:CRISPR-associated protein Cas2
LRIYSEKLSNFQGIKVSPWATSGKEMVEALTRKVEAALPEGGKVDILQFTDKQYENIVSFRGRTKGPPRKNPEQFVLF